ncbi:MAG: M56 family metallopeptidase [Vicinamibacterales bacterium]
MTLLLENAVKSAAIIGVALALMPLLRSRAAAMRHSILAAALVGAALTPLMRPLLPTWRIPLSVVGSSEAALNIVGTPDTIGAVASGVASPVTAPLVSAIPIIGLAVWLAGALAGITLLTVGWIRLLRLTAGAQRISDEIWVSCGEQVRREYNLRSPLLLQTSHPSLLVTWGIRRPRVLVPARALNWPVERIRPVLAHELAHIRRGDWVVQIAAEFVRACYWFNPLVWVACNRLRQESEQACDDEVINRGIDGSEYAAHLVNIARELRPPLLWVPAPSIARTSNFERRVRVMLDRKVNRRPMSRAASLATLVAMLAIVIPVTGAAVAQVFGTVAGSIVDPMNAAVPDVTLVLTNTQTNAKHEVRSDRTGRYEFVGLVPGDYVLEAKLPGFAMLRGRLTVAAQSVQQDLKLEIGSLQETISVRASRSGADPSSPGTAGSPAARKDPPKCGSGSQSATPVGGNIRPPRKLYDVRPLYPASAIRGGAEGTVTLQSRIGADGTVEDVQVVSTPSSDLASAATEAVRQWLFDPTYLNCVAVPVTMNVTVNFALTQ